MTTDIERDIRERDACYAPLPPHILPDSPEMAYIDRRTLLRLLDEAREGREALLRENEALRKDAERYRWLRGECYTLTKHAAVTYTDQNEHVAMWCKEHVRENTSAAVDAAVDADRAAAKEKP